MTWRILGLADRVEEIVYSPRVREHFGDVDLVIACGDLPYSYIEYVVSSLDRPVFYVRGNHDKRKEDGPAGMQQGPLGAVDLHGEVVRLRGLLLAGVEGSLRYKPGPFQYSQLEMWWHVLRLVPGMLSNRLRFGRWLDVFVSHAPAEGIHDRDDLPHQGIAAFRWLLRTFRPALHLHGHVHLYGPNTPIESRFEATRVVNAYGSRRVDLDLASAGSREGVDDSEASP